MTSMVERPARKLCRLYYRGVCGPKEAPDSHWGLFVNDARDVIEGTFNVTDEDAQAFFDDDDALLCWLVDAPDDSNNHRYLTFRQAFQDLADAALKERS